MKAIIKYRGRIVTSQDITFIRTLINRNPTASRRKLSKLLCEAWHWRQTNGTLKDMVCRGLMLALHRQGHIELPPPRNKFTPGLRHKTPSTRISIDQTPFRGKLSDLQPLHFLQVRRTPQEKLYNGLIQKYHYLGYSSPVGEHLKYVIYAHKRPIACMAWSSAPRHIGARDRFIGWDQEIRKKNIHLIAYNTRFLLLPWIEVKYLASHILGRMVRRISSDWENLYHHPVYYLETFIC